MLYFVLLAALCSNFLVTLFNKFYCILNNPVLKILQIFWICTHYEIQIQWYFLMLLPFLQSMWFSLIIFWIFPYFTVIVTDWLTLCEKCPNMELFWSVFSRNWTEYGDLLYGLETLRIWTLFVQCYATWSELQNVWKMFYATD